MISYRFSDSVLYREDDDGVTETVPFLIGHGDVRSSVLVSMLADYLSNDRQAVALAPAVAYYFPHKLASEDWIIPEDHLEYIITLVFVKVKEYNGLSSSLEYMGGQRRDLIRKALTE